jgi:hypothetical protein
MLSFLFTINALLLYRVGKTATLKTILQMYKAALPKSDPVSVPDPTLVAQQEDKPKRRSKKTKSTQPVDPDAEIICLCAPTGRAAAR